MNEIKLIQIEPTTRCNFTCAFCSGRHMEQLDLDFDTYKAVIDQIDGIKYIELQGEGEPFLHTEIYDMIRYAKNKNIQISSITNGSLFNPANIEKILDSGLNCLNISIESPDKDEFKKIRGGNLDKITEGIRGLVARKKERGLEIPVIGFSVTVLKSTASNLKMIFELYQALDMDGGIAIQFLNESKEYSKHYSMEETSEYLTKQEQLLVRRNYFRWLKDIRVNSSIEHFFAKMEQNMKLNGGKEGYCVWLENAMYVSCQGYATSCVYMKDGEHNGLGHIRRDGIDKILEMKMMERNKLRKGALSENCSQVNCEIVRKITEGIPIIKNSGEGYE